MSSLIDVKLRRPLISRDCGSSVASLLAPTSCRAAPLFASRATVIRDARRLHRRRTFSGSPRSRTVETKARAAWHVSPQRVAGGGAVPPREPSYHSSSGVGLTQHASAYAQAITPRLMIVSASNSAIGRRSRWCGRRRKFPMYTRAKPARLAASWSGTRQRATIFSRRENIRQRSIRCGRIRRPTAS